MINKKSKYYALEFELDDNNYLIPVGFFSRYCKSDGNNELREIAFANPDFFEKYWKSQKINYSVLNTQVEYDRYVNSGAKGQILITEELIKTNVEWFISLPLPFSVETDANWAKVSNRDKSVCLILHKYYETTQRKLTAAKLAERDQIMERLAHSIKGLIRSVETPLGLVVKDTEIDEYNKVCIQDALRGLELIKEMAFVIDHSYTGSIDDFKFDATCEAGDGETLQGLILKALVHAAVNMFDRDYFETFSFNYFPEKKHREPAEKKYNDIIKDYDLHKIVRWINKHFLKFSVDVDKSVENRLKDTKSSAMKFFMMMHEMLLNSIKYASFVPENKRFLAIKVKEEKGSINISVKNSMASTAKEKTTGKGSFIIAKFAEILGHDPEIIKSANPETYEVKIKFENFWKKKNVTYKIDDNPEFLKVSEKKSNYNA